MKILWISHLIPYPPKGGVLIRSYNLIKELGKKHDVDLLMFNQKRLLVGFFPSEDVAMKAAIKAVTPYIKEYWIEPIPNEQSTYHRIILAIKSFFSKTPYTIQWLKSERASKLMEKIMKDNRYDLVHFDTISLDVYRPIVQGRAKMVLNHHNIESHMMGRRAANERSILKKLYFQWEYKKLYKYEQENLPDYDGHIVCSEDDARRLRELSGIGNIAVVPNGIDVCHAEPVKCIDAGTLLFIGGLGWYPNIDAIYHFIGSIKPILDNSNINYKVDIIGRNPPQKLVEHALVDKTINILGYVDNISKYYERGNIYICPIRDGGGTKLKILDAFANKMAVVAYPLACEGIEIEHGKNVMIAEDEKQFANYIIELLNDNEKCIQLGGNAYNLIKDKYNYNSIGRRMSDYYMAL